MRLAGLWGLELFGRLCVGAFSRNMVFIAVKILSHIIYFKIKLYKFCVFNVICMENTSINLSRV
jgi:hypothetical protein